MVQQNTHARKTEVETVSRPYIEEIKQSVERIDTFAGLDKRTVIAEGRFSSMKNMSARKYPLLSTRSKRSTLSIPGADSIDGKYTGLISKDKLVCTKGKYIYTGAGDEWVDIGLDERDKQLISFGTYVVILPDKKYYNYADSTDYGDIEARYHTENLNVNTSYCKADGTSLVVKTYGDTAPENPENGEYWLDTSGKTPEMKQYSSYSLSWVSVISAFTKITCGSSLQGDAIGQSFKEGDSVTITIPAEAIGDNPHLKAFNGSFVLSHVGSDSESIVVPVIADNAYNFTGITVERKMPDMDFVIESGNRLWGCFYGEGEDGKRLNEIYASSLGDFRNWRVYQGISTDSWTTTVGTTGNFTGAVNYRGYPHFFKENALHKITGYAPSSYQISTVEIDGIGDRCGRSVADIDGILYYKSRTGVCAYDGSFPTQIGDALGRYASTGSVGGDAFGRYYITIDEDLYCYNTNTGIWTLEDTPGITHFCNHDGVLYYTDGKSIYGVDGDSARGTTEGNFEWFAETGDMGLSYNERKYISRLVVRMSLALDARATVSISYDSSGVWETIYDADGEYVRTYNINIRPKRCDHFRLRIEGYGECDVYSITKYISAGSIL